MKRHDIPGHGGVNMAVFEDGPADAPAILLVHGWSQHHLSWERQFPLARDHRLIMPDLRGHGASGKPEGAETYKGSQIWGDDIAAIFDTLNLQNVMLVGWSMGGFVVLDYLRQYGDARLSGVVIIGAHLTPGSFMPPEIAAMRRNDDAVRADGMYSDDDGENVAATLAFVRACFHQQPDPDDLARMVGLNMLSPPHARAASRGRSEDYHDAARATQVPAMVIWGTEERLAPAVLGEEAARTFPKGRGVPYPNCGHTPFWEEHERFNRELAEFVRECRA